NPPCEDTPEAALDCRVLLDYADASMSGTLSFTEAGPTQLVARICGARRAADWHRTKNPGGFGGPTILDLLVVGASAFGFQSVPTQPDIDVDHDGLERFMDTDNDGAVDLCIDGNGTQLQGVDCPLDPRIADAYSEAWDVQAVGAQWAGLWK